MIRIYACGVARQFPECISDLVLFFLKNSGPYFTIFLYFIQLFWVFFVFLITIDHFTYLRIPPPEDTLCFCADYFSSFFLLSFFLSSFFFFRRLVWEGYLQNALTDSFEIFRGYLSQAGAMLFHFFYQIRNPIWLLGGHLLFKKKIRLFFNLSPNQDISEIIYLRLVQCSFTFFT